MEQHMILMARKPTHPGEVLREEFMPDYGLTVASTRPVWCYHADR